VADLTVWFTPKLAAEYAKVSVVTLRRATKRGALKPFPVNGGNRIRYRAADIDAWLMTAPEPEVRA
jgi:excisionase family DNA binding protein